MRSGRQQGEAHLVGNKTSPDNQASTPPCTPASDGCLGQRNQSCYYRQAHLPRIHDILPTVGTSADSSKQQKGERGLHLPADLHADRQTQHTHCTTIASLLFSLLACCSCVKSTGKHSITRCSPTASTNRLRRVSPETWHEQMEWRKQAAQRCTLRAAQLQQEGKGLRASPRPPVSSPADVWKTPSLPARHKPALL